MPLWKNEELPSQLEKTVLLLLCCYKLVHCKYFHHCNPKVSDNIYIYFFFFKKGNLYMFKCYLCCKGRLSLRAWQRQVDLDKIVHLGLGGVRKNVSRNLNYPFQRGESCGSVCKEGSRVRTGISARLARAVELPSPLCVPSMAKSHSAFSFLSSFWVPCLLDGQLPLSLLLQPHTNISSKNCL